MTGAEFKNLQIGMWVTDVEVTLVKADFCKVRNFDRMGRLQLWPYGQPIEKSFWIYYKDYDLKDSMYESEFKEWTV